MESSLHIQLSEEGADAERLETLTRYLRHELVELDAGEVTPLRVGEPPAGTRALDVIAVGGLVVSWISSDGLRSVVAAVRSWLARDHSATAHTIRLEIDGDVLDLASATTAEQERLIELFVSRHGPGKGS